MSTSPRRVPLDNKPPTKKAERGALLWSILKRLGEFARPMGRRHKTTHAD